MIVRCVAIADCADIEGAAVVVDVLRAFSTAAYAAAWGAKRLLLVESLAAALDLAERRPDSLTMKDGPPDPRFDLVNSPGHLRGVDLVGRVIVQKTTAGTVGALAARPASPLLCASFVNAGATARFLQRASVDSVTFVISGDDGHADEDQACADYIAALLSGRTDLRAEPFLAKARSSRAKRELDEGVADRSEEQPVGRKEQRRVPHRVRGHAHERDNSHNAELWTSSWLRSGATDSRGGMRVPTALELCHQSDSLRCLGGNCYLNGVDLPSGTGITVCMN